MAELNQMKKKINSVTTAIQQASQSFPFFPLLIKGALTSWIRTDSYFFLF